MSITDNLTDDDLKRLGPRKVLFWSRILSCPKCFGNGFIPEPYYIKPELDEYSEIDYNCPECRHCHGTGKRFWFFYKKLP